MAKKKLEQPLIPTMDQLPKLYRNVILGAARDIGAGSGKDASDVRRWMQRPEFGTVCELANWSQGFVVDLLTSLGTLTVPVRHGITAQCAQLLSAIIRITDPCDTDDPVNMAPGLGSAEHDSKYIGESAPGTPSKRISQSNR